MTASCASTASCSGCTRTLSAARAYGETALTAPSTDGTSMPITVIAGPDQTRDPRPPVPISGMPSSTVPSSRKSSSGCCSPSHSSRRSPATATSPRASCSEPSARTIASSASGAAPPYWPLCLPDSSVRASTVTLAIPRSAMVSVGIPGRIEPMSPITSASARKRSGSVAGYAVSAPLPISSWPSMQSLIPTGGRPSHARSAPTWARMFDFVSATPRAKSAPSRSAGSNGGEVHSASSPAGTTS